MAPISAMAKKIKARRRVLRMSQAELARRAKISRTHLRRLESAEQEPTLGVIERLAKALNVHPGKLF